MLVVGRGTRRASPPAIEARRLGLDASSSTRPASRGTRPAATASPPARCACSTALGLDVRTLPSYAPVTDTVLVVARPAARSVVPLPARRARTPASSPASSSTPRSSTSRATRGVDVRDGTGVTALSTDGDAVTRDARRRHRASPRGGSIAADGHYSPVRRDARRRGGDAARPDSRTAGTRSGSTSAASTTAGCGCSSRRTSSPGTRGCSRSAAAAPTSASACCATGTTARPSGKALAAQWRCARRSPERAAGPRPERRAPTARCAPGRSPRTTTGRALAHGRVLFAGDAANVVDPMTGEGIAQALETGALAAAGHRESPDDTARGRRALPRRRRPRARRRPALRRAPAARPARAARRARRDPRRPRSRRGPGATSPAGCSRTTPAPLVLTPRRWRRGMFASGRGLLPTLDRWPSLTTGSDAALVHRHPARHPAPARRRARRSTATSCCATSSRRSPSRSTSALEYMDWKSGGDTNFAPVATADGELDCRGFWKPGDERPDKGGRFTSNARAVPEHRRRGRVGRRRLRARARDQARAAELRRRAAPDPPRRQQPLQPRGRRLGRAGVDRAHRQPRQLHGPHGAGPRRPPRSRRPRCASRCTAARASSSTRSGSGTSCATPAPSRATR